MNKQLFRLLFGVLCFVWVGNKLYDLLTPTVVMTNTQKTLIIVGIFAFSIIGVDNLLRWWKQRNNDAGNN